jgi:GNAT superfamily N-acetyltransferase
MQMTRLPGGELVRLAVADDVQAVVDLIVDDPVESARAADPTATPPRHWDAFAAIDADPNNELIVLEDPHGGRILGTLQLVYIESLNWGGGLRGQIQGVRICPPVRGRGLGTLLISWAIDRARNRGCVVVQLSTDKNRIEAHRLYRRLGFRASHEGFKLRLGP